MPAYLGRDAAKEAYGGDDGHLYQGDLLESLEFTIQLPDGVNDGKLWDVIVVSHDCEYTKVAEKAGHPLLVAPVRPISDFENGQHPLVRQGKNFALSGSSTGVARGR